MISLWTAAALRRTNALLVHSEVVRNFVPKRVKHQLSQMITIARHAFVRPLENRDAIRLREAFEDAALG